MPTRQEVIATALQIAVHELGVHEVGNNRGARVEEYQRAAGSGPGAPWCASFMYWVIREACQRTGVADDPFIRSAYCPTVAQWARDHGILHGEPAAGDVFLLYGQSRQGYRAHHTGMVASVSGGRVGTIEGNTNSTGGSEGVAVLRHDRPVTGRLRFVRWPTLLPDTAAARTWELYLNAVKVADMPVSGGHALAPVRVWGEALGFHVGWNHEAQAFLFDGQEVPIEPALIDGHAYAPITDLVENAGGLELVREEARRRVTIRRVKPAAP